MVKHPQWICSCGTKDKSLFLDALPPVQLPLSNPAWYPKAGRLSPLSIGTQPLPAFLLQWTSDPRGRSIGSTKSIEPLAQFVRLVSTSQVCVCLREASYPFKHLMTWASCCCLCNLIVPRVLPGHCGSMRIRCSSHTWVCLLLGLALLVSKQIFLAHPMFAFGQILMYGFLALYCSQCVLCGRSYALITLN